MGLPVIERAGARSAMIRGETLWVHPEGDYVSDEVVRTGDFYEADVLDSVARHLEDRPSGDIVDVGAMIGNHTLYLAAFTNHETIHAFEPLEANLRLLRRNTETVASVAIHGHALSDRERVIRMTVDPSNFGHARSDIEGDILVAAIPLDELRLEDVALVKIDVEGHEPNVIRGAWDTLIRWRPLVVLEDWDRDYRRHLPPGYHLVESWPDRQTYLYAWE